MRKFCSFVIVMWGGVGLILFFRNKTKILLRKTSYINLNYRRKLWKNIFHPHNTFRTTYNIPRQNISNFITFSLSMTIKQLSKKSRKNPCIVNQKIIRKYPSQLMPLLSLPNPLPKWIEQTQEPEQLPKPQFP